MWPRSIPIGNIYGKADTEVLGCVGRGGSLLNAMEMSEDMDHRVFIAEG